MLTTILLLAVAGTVIAVIIGSFWYSPGTPTGKLHMQYTGFDKLTPEEQKAKINEMKPKMPKIYGAQMVLSFLISIETVFIIYLSMNNGVPFVTSLAFVVANWLCFMVPIIGSNILWGTCDPKIAWKKFFSDSLNNLTVLVLVAIMTSFFIH